MVAAAETLTEIGGKDVVYVRTGGTFPIAEVFKHHLGAEMVFYAFSLETLQRPCAERVLPDRRLPQRHYCHSGLERLAK
ncbi:MAG: hypothetical protein R2855_10165 [Thermomicrobiales bacterium]